MSHQEKPLTHPTSKEEALIIECNAIATVLKGLLSSLGEYEDSVVLKTSKIQTSIDDAKMTLDAYGYKFDGEVNGK